jgi:hypothetical protein
LVWASGGGWLSSSPSDGAWAGCMATGAWAWGVVVVVAGGGEGEIEGSRWRGRTWMRCGAEIESDQDKVKKKAKGGRAALRREVVRSFVRSPRCWHRRRVRCARCLSCDSPLLLVLLASWLASED